MGFWIFILITDVLIPITMIVFGKMFLNNIPEKINVVFGYRTSMSMKNESTWKFAHNYCGKIWYNIGKILLPLSIISMLFVIGKNEDAIGALGGIICAIQLIILIGSIPATEIAIRRVFYKNGSRR